MKLHEILGEEDVHLLAYTHLRNEGFDVELDHSYGHPIIIVKGSAFEAHLLYSDITDSWLIAWFHNGRRTDTDRNLSFDEVEEKIQPLKPSWVDR